MGLICIEEDDMPLLLNRILQNRLLLGDPILTAISFANYPEAFVRSLENTLHHATFCQYVSTLHQRRNITKEEVQAWSNVAVFKTKAGRYIAGSEIFVPPHGFPSFNNVFHGSLLQDDSLATPSSPLITTNFPEPFTWETLFTAAKELLAPEYENVVACILRT
jgi:hypothetical protein